MKGDLKKGHARGSASRLSRQPVRTGRDPLPKQAPAPTMPWAVNASPVVISMGLIALRREGTGLACGFLDGFDRLLQTKELILDENFGYETRSRPVR